MKKVSYYKVRNVKSEVKKAISLYCKEKGITQSNFLENDKRIKNYL